MLYQPNRKPATRIFPVFLQTLYRFGPGIFAIFYFPPVTVIRFNVPLVNGFSNIRHN